MRLRIVVRRTMNRPNPFFPLIVRRLQPVTLETLLEPLTSACSLDELPYPRLICGSSVRKSYEAFLQVACPFLLANFMQL